MTPVCFLQISCILTRRTMNDRILADFCQCHEFMGICSADCAGISFNGTELQAATCENVNISIEHRLIAGIEAAR